MNAAALAFRTSSRFSQSVLMLRHWVVNAAALKVLTFKKNFSGTLNAATLGCECRSIGHTDFHIFFFLKVNAAALEDECRGIGASAKTQIFPSCLNAAALVTECCGIELSAKMNAGAFIPECRGIEPCFCTPLLLYFSTLFLLIFWPEQPMNHKMKEINDK